MDQFLLIFLFALARSTFGVRSLSTPFNPNDDIDVSDYVLPDEFFPENDRDAIPVIQQIPDIDVSQYTLPDEFYPENDRDAVLTRRFLHRRPPLKFQPRPGDSTQLGRVRGVKNEMPVYEWNMRMRKKNARTMNLLGNPAGIFDHCCPFHPVLF